MDQAVTSDRPQANELVVEFFMGAVLDEKASNGWVEERYNPDTGETRKYTHLGAGRPIYVDVEFISIRIPGNVTEHRVRQVRPSDKTRFTREYAAFQQTKQNPVIGTPIDELPFLTAARKAELKALGLRTAENILSISDVDGQKFMDFNSLKGRVKAYLDSAAGQAPLDGMRKEIESKDSEIATLKTQLAELAKLDKARK